MDFVLYLHREKLLDAETAMRVLQEWAARRPLLGSIAVKHGILSVRDVMQIVGAQATATRRQRFGRTAVSMGMLSEDMLELLLEEQQRLQPDVVTVFEELTGRASGPLLAAWRGRAAA